MLEVNRVFKSAGHDRETANAHGKQQQVGGVELADARADPANPRPPAVTLDCAAVGQRRGKAGEQNEQLRSVTQTEVPKRQSGELVTRNMVDKNANERETAKKIDPQIAWWSERQVMLGTSNRPLGQRIHVRMPLECRFAACDGCVLH